MKQLLLGLSLAALAIPTLSARGTVSLDGYEYTVDTIYHKPCGPGTTQTRLALRGRVYLDVFYLTVDKTTPGVSIRTVSGKDMLAGNETPSAMSKRKTKGNVHYFGGTNGDFYYTAGTASNGSSIVGTPVCASTVDGEVYRTANSSYQFSVDDQGFARVCRLNYTKGTAKCGDAEAPFKTINNDAPNNAVTLYTSKFWGSANQGGCAGSCSEVTAKLAEGETFTAGRTFKLEVTSEPTSTGDLAVPADGFVIMSRGTANSFVSALKPGDIVEFDNKTLTPDGEQIYPVNVISGNPKNIGGGENLHSEAERGDANQRHPRTGIGVSLDNKTVVMMVVDGRSTSAGVTTGELGDLMLYAGAGEGVNLDGGGSSCIYTTPYGILNHNSDGQERAVCNGVFAVYEGPDDANVAELCFTDGQLTVPYMGIYTPQMISRNAAGMLLDTDFKDYTLSCPAELGEIINDGKTLFVTGSGYHALTATYGDCTVSIPILVDNASEAELVYQSVILDKNHPYNVKLNSGQFQLNAKAFGWSTADASIATVDADGNVSAVENGSTTILGTLGDLTLEQGVTIQNPRDQVEALAPAADVAAWSTAKSGLKDIVYTSLDNGFAVEYTISSGTGTSFTVNPKATVYGIPEAMRIRINPGDATLRGITVSFRDPKTQLKTQYSFSTFEKNTENVLDLPLSEIYDVADHGIFPLEVLSVSFGLADPKNTKGRLEVPGIEFVYNCPAGVTDAEADGDSNSLNIMLSGDVATLPFAARNITVADAAGRILATGSGNSIALPHTAGVMIITADGLSAKIR